MLQDFQEIFTLKITFIEHVSQPAALHLSIVPNSRLFSFEGEGEVLLGGVVKHLEVDLEPLVDGIELFPR